MAKRVYRFGDGHAEGKARPALLGNKGASLAAMSALGLPVPPGFTIATDVCTAFHANGRLCPEGLAAEVEAGIAHIERLTGRRFGGAADPLLVSVRSGAAASMPGMLDTVLNLGLNDRTVLALAEAAGDERFAWDSYRRFIQAYGSVVMGLDHGVFEDLLEEERTRLGHAIETPLGADDCQTVVRRYKAMLEAETGSPFPQDPHQQLWGAIRAGFTSWMSARAVTC
ncbi:MAG TPA: PEP/pyruvate-binding domain-containing protein, partial [Pararhizobium sp.]|nr:PEP/pyruvate-binding domain-containing protein [Pararhizobium sp.]